MCGKRAHNRSGLMHAIGQHERLSLSNGLLLVQMFSQADKLRTVSRGVPGVREKKKDIRISKLKIECQPTERIFE
jgi:hypothetical protein